jgi:uncharacterized protein YwgA
MEKRLSLYTSLELLLLAVLYVDDASPIKGRLWLQKIIFVLDRNIDEIKAKFDGYRIGPFSENLEIALEQFIGSGYIEIDKHKRILLTQKGKDFAQNIIPHISKERMEIILDIKRFLNDLNEHELIAVIYSTFPEYTDKSDIKNQFEAYRLEAARSLYNKGKISLSKAADISGLKIDAFIKIIKDKSI